MNRQQEKPVTDQERDGLKKVVEAIRSAWERAKERQSAKRKGDKKDPVHHHMALDKVATQSYDGGSCKR